MRQNRLRGVCILERDHTRLVFVVAQGRDDRIVFGFHVHVGDGHRLCLIAQIGSRHRRRLRLFDRGHHLRADVVVLLLGSLAEQLARDQLIL